LKYPEKPGTRKESKMNTIAKSQRDATDYEKTTLHAIRNALFEQSLEVGSCVSGAKNELAEKGGLLMLELSERIAYDYEIRPSIMRVYKELNSYVDNNASQATQLRRRAEELVLENALQIRDLLNRGVL
jgi:hypothetical protein